MNVFLQAIPANMNMKQLEGILIEKRPIQSIHDCHLWTMDGEYHLLSCHVVVADNLPSKDIIVLKTQIRSLLKQYNIQHLTIEVEYENEGCELVNC